MPPKELMSVVSTTRYPLDAFIFVQRGLDYTVRRVHGEIAEECELDAEQMRDRHVGGETLCWGLRDYAYEQYGLLARAVLKRWQVYACEDFGRIVFAMIEADLMHKTEDDQLEDFIDIYDFADAFSHSLELSEHNLAADEPKA